MVGAVLLFLLVAQAPPPPSPAGPGTVAGVVRGDAGSGRAPLEHAMVEWRGAGRRTVLTDHRGVYRLEGVPAGRARIRVEHAGHEPMELEVSVPPGGFLSVDVELRPRPVLLPSLTVRAPAAPPAPDPDSARSGAAPALQEAGLRALEGGTGLAESGIGQAFGRGGKGEGEPPEPGSVLLMRGSAVESRLVLLDGAPIHTPFHVGGVIQAFDPGTLGRAELYVGGAPARYAGGLAYILDLAVREPAGDRLRAGGGVDLLSASASVEGPLAAGLRFLAAGRTLHGLGETLAGLGPSPYGYDDTLLRLDLDPGEEQALRLTTFRNRESVFLDFPGLPRGGGAPALPDGASWGNDVASATWSVVRGTTRGEVQGSLGRYRAELPLPGEESLLAAGEARRGRLSAEVSLHHLGGIVHWGAAVDRSAVTYRVRPLASGDGPHYGERAEALVAGGYVDGTWTLAPTVRLRGGVRADHFSGREGGLRLAPRFALTWLVAPEAALTLAAGRYHQHARGGEARGEALEWAAGGGTVSGPIRSDVYRRLDLPVAAASHLVLSLDQQPAPGVRLGVEGFLKRFYGVAGESPDLHSSGLDLRVHRVGERISGWVGYSLSWFWAPSRSGGEGPDFAGRHLLAVGADTRMGDRAGLDLRVSFGDGLPYTSLPVGQRSGTLTQATDELRAGNSDFTAAGFTGGPAEAFLRLDAEFYGVLTPSLGGRRGEVRPFLRILNALDRRDALFYYFDPWRGDRPQPLTQASILPVAGVQWRF